MSLAAFLILFTFCRDPGIVYETEAVFRGSVNRQVVSESAVEGMRTELERLVLKPEFVLDAMRQADIIRGDVSSETLKIAASIADRMRLRADTYDGQAFMRLSLVTERPQAGITLLNSMGELVPTTIDTGSLVTNPATITRQRGGSISAFELIWLCVTSCLAGVAGLAMCKNTQESPIILTRAEVRELAGVPIVGDFDDSPSQRGESAGMRIARQRTFGAAMRVAELAVAAVFFLMLYQFATRDALLDRFLVDPLATYGEVLTHVIG